MRIHIFFSLGNLKTIYKDRVKYDYVELLQKYKKKQILLVQRNKHCSVNQMIEY